MEFLVCLHEGKKRESMMSESKESCVDTPCHGYQETTAGAWGYDAYGCMMDTKR